MEYIEIIKAISNFGVLIVIAGIFLWEHITRKKKLQESDQKDYNIIEEIKTSNLETKNSFEILEKNLQIQKEFLEKMEKYYKKIGKEIKQNTKK